MKLPTFDDRQKMWSEVDFPLDPSPFADVERYVSAFSSIYTNGKVTHACFHLPSHPILDWYVRGNQVREAGFFEKFWLAPSVAERIPQKLANLNFYSDNVFEWDSPFMLAGSLAWCLAGGGAYTKNHSSLHAKMLADGVAEELLEDDYDSPQVFKSRAAWSNYFLDVAWDYTWILIQPVNKRIHVILATDSD